MVLSAALHHIAQRPRRREVGVLEQFVEKEQDGASRKLEFVGKRAPVGVLCDRTNAFSVGFCLRGLVLFGDTRGRFFFEDEALSGKGGASRELRGRGE